MTTRFIYVAAFAGAKLGDIGFTVRCAPWHDLPVRA